MKVVTVVGARPQFIKAAVVSRAFKTSGKVEEIIIHTGQHYDTNMSDVFFEEMSIPKPQVNLDVHGLGHGAMTGQMLEKIEKVLIDELPDWVIVYGDTNSTIAGALAAKKLHLKVAHVEAGLRSFNMKMPEEINRILTDRISDLLLCPTEYAVENLQAEGFELFSSKIVKLGDVMLDAALFYSKRSQKPNFSIPSRFILCTIHREENTEDILRLRSIFLALEEVSKGITIVLPLHPRTKSKLKNIGYEIENSNICFVSPVGYLEMVYLLKNCEIVITDSGGLQKEAFFFKKNCVTLRDETEWKELIDNGFNILAGSQFEKIVNCCEDMLVKKTNNFSINLYGDGRAGEKILEELLLGI